MRPKIVSLVTLAWLLCSHCSQAKLTVQQERGFLKALGLDHVPHIQEQRPNNNIPESIKELYRQQKNKATTQFNLPGRHVGASNTLRTFNGRQVGGCGSANSLCVLAFDLNPNVYKSEQVASAQLRIYWNPNDNRSS